MRALTQYHWRGCHNISDSCKPRKCCNSGILDLIHAVQDLLAMLPQPVIALLLLFPITDESEAASKAGKGTPC